jgi:hypothetical protein
VKIRRTNKPEIKPLNEKTGGDILFFKKNFIIPMLTVNGDFWIYSNFKKHSF